MQINNLFLRYVFAVVGLLAFAPMLPTAPAKPMETSSRVALVIGNDRYEAAVGPLRNAGRDAKAMAKALGNLGFTVIEKHNVTRDELLAAMLQFRARLRGAEVGLFYFAGHGISVAGANYLLPIKSGYTPEAAGDAERRLLAETRLFNAEQAVAEMIDAKTRCNLVILDACRSTPVARNPGTRDATSAGGLVEMNPPAGSLVAFATDAGHAAADGAGANGLYTEELIKHLLTPGLTIEQVFKRTRAGVMERSGGTQIPAEYSRLVGDDIFLAGPASVVRAEKAPAKTDALLTLAEIQKLAITGDPAVTIQALRTYVGSHGPEAHDDVPLATILERVKETLRDPTIAKLNAEEALKTCDLVLSAIADLLSSDHPQRGILNAKAQNRRGDALLLLGRPKEALASYNAAAALDPNDAYILYNRGRAFLALDRKDEAKADFTTAAGAKFKRSGAHKLALDALLEMK